MLDSYVRPYINRPLEAIAKLFVQRGVSANFVTYSGFIIGLLAMPCLIFQNYDAAIGFILLNRLLDGVDGAIARLTQSSHFGSILDIVCDFIFYASIPFALGIARPENSIWAAFIIFSFIGPISSFLAYAIIAEKQQRTSSKRGIKSFYHMGGICEGTETSVFLITLCLFPDYFALQCLIFGIMCLLTTIGRLYQAWNDFR